MCVPDDRSFDSSVHPTRDDIAVDNTHSPSIMRVSIKQSKTDPFPRGVNLFMGRTSTELCPVSAMLNYLVVRARVMAHCLCSETSDFRQRNVWWLFSGQRCAKLVWIPQSFEVTASGLGL